MRKKLCVFLFPLLGLLGCSTDSESDLVGLGNDGGDPGPITYTADIKAIVGSNCLGCHMDPPINGAPFPLTTYERVKSVAESGLLLTAISRQTGEVRAMPPTGRLPQATIDKVEQWIADGLLEH